MRKLFYLLKKMKQLWKKRKVVDVVRLGSSSIKCCCSGRSCSSNIVDNSSVGLVIISSIRATTHVSLLLWDRRVVHLVRKRLLRWRAALLSKTPSIGVRERWEANII